MGGLMSDEDDEIVQEFLVESHENLDQLDRDLVDLEQQPGSRELLSSIFRTIHTIKGTSGFLAFSRLESLTHVGENLLSRLRDGEQAMSTGTADALLLMVDTVRALLTSIEATGAEGDVDVDAAVAALSARLEPRDPAPHAQTDAATQVDPQTETVTHAQVSTEVATRTDAQAEAATHAHVEAAIEAPVSIGTAAAIDTGASIASEPEPHQSVEPTLPPDGRRAAADSSLRVDIDVLDALMRLAGELVLTRNQVIRGVSDLTDPGLLRTAQRLNVITTDLQESIMKTRMQPIDHLWSKLPRIVRDLGLQCGREVRLDMSGNDTELDRTLLGAIKDPLTHLVRNAVDHGIETPQRRLAAGKPAEGRLSLRAFHNSGQVIIEVADDGAGMDPARIGRKAIERGIRTAEQIADMTDAEILQLVFQPGFSTAEAVTNVSGRGVGMDVVRTNVEAIGGAIEIESELGVGTICRLRVPLTMAIVPALTVECGGGRYAIPQISLLEVVALSAVESKASIESVAGAQVYRLRGSLLPLLDLADVLETPRDDDGARPSVIAVLQGNNGRFGLLVDAVANTEEIVVKALSARLSALGAYSGATILGDGTVALILDVQHLARRALRAETTDRGVGPAIPAPAHVADEAERLLVAGIGDGRRVAIPLTMITRLEMIEAARIEAVGMREVVHYRGAIVPLLRLSNYLGLTSAGDATELPVAVYSRAGHSVGIVVDEIIDIAEPDGDVQGDVTGSGFTGSVVVKGQIVGLLDVDQAILAADPEFFAADPAPGATDTRRRQPRLTGHAPRVERRERSLV